MKSIYSGAKQQLSSCMLHDSDDPTPTTLLNNNHNHNHTNNSNSNNNNNNCNHYYYNNNNTHHSSTNNSHNQSITTTTTTSSDINDDNSSFILAAISANRTTTTYDTSQSPFKYDKNRGRWSSAADFYFACTSHAFGTVVFSEVPVYALLFGGVYFFPAYLFAILLYGIPIFIIQTFLGQFSTSGAISAFRVAPIFKGIGYSILLLNLTSLTYYGVIAAVPLIYAANSLFTVIPWMSCDNEWNTPNCSTHSTFEYEDEHLHHHSTVEFFHSLIRSADDHKTNFQLSWPLLYTTIAIWIFTTSILLKRVSFIGKFFRCTCLLMLALFLAIFVHLLFYVHLDWDTFAGYFKPALGSTESIGSSFGAAILMASWVLGPGWGNVLTLASHNNFRHDSERLTYWVSATHVVLAVMAMICGRIALDHFEDEVGMFHDHVEEDHYMQFLYLCFAYLFGSFSSLPNFWCFLFFFMLFLAEICAVIIQIMSILSSIFDEFEKLRSRKTVITISLSLVLLLFSVYFCTKKGFEHLHLLPTIVVLSHVIISFILLLMTTWIYGRERFQCDLQFMLGKTISNFKIFLIRFVTPVFLVMSLLQVLFFLERDDPPSLLLLLSQSAVVLVAPGYMIHKVCQTTGSLRQRLKQCFAPHDWHPVDADNRRFYEEVMGTSEMLVIDSDGQSHGHNEC